MKRWLVLLVLLVALPARAEIVYLPMVTVHRAPPTYTPDSLFSDDFSTCDRGWTELDLSGSKAFCGGGHYTVQVNPGHTAQVYNYDLRRDDVAYAPCRFEMDVWETTSRAGAVMLSFGLGNGSAGYTIIIYPPSSDSFEAGTYRITESGVGELGSGAVTWDSTNRLRVDWTGATISLYLNGELLETVLVSSISPGANFQLNVGSHQDGSVEMCLDNFSLTRL